VLSRDRSGHYLLVVVGLGLFGCSSCPTPSTVDGVSNGDRIQTTVVAPSTAFAPHCHGLDDLQPGSTLNVNAYFQGSSTGCAVGLNLSLQSSSEALWVPSDAGLAPTLALDGGCLASEYLEFYSVSSASDVSFYDNGADGGTWLLRRSVQAVGNCPFPLSCWDYFVANNTRL
jgi:hypothetical protein